MANWHDEPVKEVEETVETRPVSKNFYDVIRAIKDKEIQARLDYYEELGRDETRFIPDWYVPKKGNYYRHDFVNNLPYVKTPSELKLHKQRLAELDREWEQELERIKEDDSIFINEDGQPIFFIDGKGNNQKVKYVVEHYLFGVQSISETKKEFIDRTYEIKKDGSNATYIGDSGRKHNYTHPDYLIKTRCVFQGTRFGYSERESIFNEPTVKFNKKGDPMATAKATDVIKDILTKNGATVAKKTVTKKTKVSASDKKKKLREKWINHIVKMKTDLDTAGVKAKGVKYVPNDKKVEDSYWEVEFTLQRQELGLERGKGTFILPSKESLSDFLQDIIDAISVETLDAQILSHQRKVDKARKEAKEKKETK